MADRVLTNRQLVLVSTLAFSQTLPTVFSMGALPLIWRDLGYSLAEIGMLSLLYLPWVLKALWAPLVDRLSDTGTRRVRFLLLAQVAVTATSLSLAFLPPGGFPIATFTSIFVLAIATATADNAADAVTIRLTREPDSERVNGWREAATLAASAIGMGGGIAVASAFGWSIAVGLLAVLTATGVISTRLLRLDIEARDAVDVTSDRQRPSLIGAFRREHALLLFSVVALASAANRFTGANPHLLLADMGYSAESIALITGGVEPVIGIFGAVAAGFFAYRLGPALLLPLAILAKAIVTALLTGALYYAMPGAVILTCLFALTFLFAHIAAAFGALIMRWSRPGSEATDAAMFFTVAAIVWLLLQPLSGGLADAAGYAGLFAASTAAMLMFAAVIWLLLRRHGVLSADRQDAPQEQPTTNHA